MYETINDVFSDDDPSDSLSPPRPHPLDSLTPLKPHPHSSSVKPPPLPPSGGGNQHKSLSDSSSSSSLGSLPPHRSTSRHSEANSGGGDGGGGGGGESEIGTRMNTERTGLYSIPPRPIPLSRYPSGKPGNSPQGAKVVRSISACGDSAAASSKVHSITNRPPCPIPIPCPRSPNLSYSHSSVGTSTNSFLKVSYFMFRWLSVSCWCGHIEWS